MLTDAGEAAFERYWPPLNQRRAELIRAERVKPLTGREVKELGCIERAADCLLEMVEMPLRRFEDFCDDPVLIRQVLASEARGDIARRQAEWKAEVAL